MGGSAVTGRSKLAEEIGKMTEEMERGDHLPSYREVYTMLLRAYLEINQLDHRIRVLEGRPV